MLFAGLANGCGFYILDRMRKQGYRVGLWRTTKDWAVYREYWRIAPAKNWSRTPLPLGIASFVIAAVLVLAAVSSNQIWGRRN